MYSNVENYREYQRKWQKSWRKAHPGARSKYPNYRDQENVKPITSIVKLKVFGPKQITKIMKPKKKPTEKVCNRPLGKNRCQLCEIKVGKGHIEEKFYKLRGKKVCHQCYKEAHEKRNHKN